MATGTLPGVRQQAARDEIVRVATECFVRNGVESTSLADLAGEFGISKAGLYYYFGSKQEILAETLRSIMQAFDAEVIAPPLSDDLGTDVLLAALVSRIRDFNESCEPDRLRFFYAFLLGERTDEVQSVFTEFWEAGRRRADEIVTRGVARGELRDDIDVRRHLDAFQAAMIGADLLWLSAPERVSLAELHQSALEQLLGQVSVPGSSLKSGRAGSPG